MIFKQIKEINEDIKIIIVKNNDIFKMIKDLYLLYIFTVK